jgi:hypothetical protein
VLKGEVITPSNSPSWQSVTSKPNFWYLKQQKKAIMFCCVLSFCLVVVGFSFRCRRRFCSAGVPEVSALYNSATGLGVQEHIGMVYFLIQRALLAFFTHCTKFVLL